MILFLKMLFPSWRFFDQVGVFFHLQIRTAANIENLEGSTWTQAVPHQRQGANAKEKTFSWTQIFFNPMENQRLYLQSCIDTFTEEHQQHPEADWFKETKNKELFQRILKQRSDLGFYFQFRILVLDPDSTSTEVEILRSSPKLFSEFEASR